MANNLTFENYIADMEAIAAAHVELKSSYIIDEEEILGGLRDGVKYPCVFIEAFEGQLNDNGADLVTDNKTCAFTVLITGGINDIPVRRANLEKTRQIGLDIVSRLRKYKRNMDAEYLKWRALDLNSFAYNKVGPVFDDAYGYRFTFTIQSPENMQYNQTKWND